MAFAQFRTATIGIDGLTCSMCSFGVQRSIEKLDFVVKVSVDLNDNVAYVEFNGEMPVDISAIVRSVRDAGFSVRSLKAKFLLSEPVDLNADPFIAVDNSVYFLLNAHDSVKEGEIELVFIDKSFSDARPYQKYKKDILRISEKLPRDEGLYYFARI